MECTIEENKKECTCTYTACTRRGHCCDCVAYHRVKNQIPACFFPQDGEKTHDRSVENFIKYVGKNEKYNK